MTRAERYKRNYRLIKNTFQNTTLAKRAQTWSDATIYEKLGIKVGGKRTPEIKKLKTKRQRDYYAKKYNKFVYGVDLGLVPVKARKLARRKKSRITETSSYQEALKRDFNKGEQDRRDALWKKWSEKGSGKMPPEIEEIAASKNAAQFVGEGKNKKRLGRWAKYGYYWAYYSFVLDLDDEVIDSMLEQDIHDQYRVIYTNIEYRAVTT